MKTGANLMSGLRLGSNGLHLGHYLGCLSPLNFINNDVPLYFVIRDRETIIAKSRKLQEENLIRLLIDLSSTKYEHRLKFVLYSSLSKYLQVLINHSLDLVTLSQLINANPNRTKIKKNVTDLSLKDFLFPVEDACTYFLLNADKILMNDDNAVTVNFARNLSKKINDSLPSKIFELPMLIHGAIPRLMGYNYEKMSNSNNNAIYLSDSKKELEGKLNKLMSFKFFFRKYPHLQDQRSERKGEFSIPDDYLPFIYLRIFSQDKSIDAKLTEYKFYHTFEEFKVFFLKEMLIFFEELHNKKLEINIEHLKQKLLGDVEEAELIAKSVLQKFLLLQST